MKSKAAIFFIVLFASIIVTPTVVTLMDKNQDLTIFLSLNEEEENTKEIKGLEMTIHPIENNNNSSFLYYRIQKKKNVRFQSKNYVSQYPKILTPPPEFFTI
ncbi:hypothetical protein [Tenacibaculum caenipelagi]|uniref:Uncharacterized protein n=1 Tax=Tenacibaculum caenipelagi TaxID=1325435 RepID=A0A4R6TE48_9FLAO|nr:hypothetical protein [Tenacibaculum caenipelagi]TDQ28427.1 hypothetical protein DFQ07_0797 [Tenacibaculum caenipelagi]